MCAFKNNQFTQLWIFGYKVGWMISQLFPLGPFRENNEQRKEGVWQY